MTTHHTLIDAAQQAEPAAWMYWQSCLNDDGTQTAPWVLRYSKFKPPESLINKDITPLYPPQQPLTEELLHSLWLYTPVDYYTDNESIFKQAARAIERAHGIGQLITAGVDMELAKIKTSELTGTALDWAVAQCEGLAVRYQPFFLTASDIKTPADWDTALEYSPSTDWSQSGPIIERDRIFLKPESSSSDWRSYVISATGNGVQHSQHGPTPLVAAMRCYVASRLGDEIEIPVELK